MSPSSSWPPAPPPGGGYAPSGGVLAVAHRGGAGLAPENTLTAFGRSYALGLRYLETDVRVTADGVCVVVHDPDLARVTGTRLVVAGSRWREVRQTRVAGTELVPRLEEALDAFPDARFTIDLKDPRAIGPLAAALRRCGATDRVCIAGSADRWLADVRAVLGPGVATAMGWESLARLAVAARVGAVPYGVVPAPFAHVPLRLGRLPVFVDRLVGLAHGLGSRVLVWTVDEPAQMHRLLDAGVDGIITDRPDLLREVMLARGNWQAPAAWSVPG
jgi:glycerophosphoryl diester phosphodiesterase